MAFRLVALSIDANDPGPLARFWAAALRWQVDDDDPTAIGLVPTDGTPLRIELRAAPSIKHGQDRYHLDLTTTSTEDQEQTVTQLIELGGSHLDIGQGTDEGHVVLADPEGNELCIIAPDNRFLAGCGRLGAISGDGSEALGHFWSEVLGWPLIWDQDGETAIRDPDGTGPIISWGGPPVAPKLGKNRLHLDLAPPAGVEPGLAVERLVTFGARHLDIGQGDVPWTVLADPDGNEFCLLHR